MDVDSEKSDEEYVVDSNKNGSFEDDDEQKFIPETPIEAMFKVYEVEFPPIQNEKLWPEWYETRLRPNLAMHKKATERPVFTRFHNEIDEIERIEKRCGLCKQTGHTRKRCPNKPTEDT
ncbi:hypothetical protein Ahy_A05g022823 [Arachis hypogaea]|uniref:CCHC-type domain-containing protein n=1 Tax=Arachis hypogaea TaxID=3818 RepID=A0A445D1J9_ARAHY|nr:hypothetical protein Ahy_A05g022823 [Arachis hypogaea]